MRKAGTKIASLAEKLKPTKETIEKVLEGLKELTKEMIFDHLQNIHRNPEESSLVATAERDRYKHLHKENFPRNDKETRLNSFYNQTRIEIEGDKENFINIFSFENILKSSNYFLTNHPFKTILILKVCKVFFFLFTLFSFLKSQTFILRENNKRK